jgi:hypothetical protein
MLIREEPLTTAVQVLDDAEKRMGDNRLRINTRK